MKAQVSMEALLVIAAYAAFIAAFASFEVGLGKETAGQKTVFLQKTELNGACFLLDEFSLNGKHASMDLGLNESFVASGKKLGLAGSNQSVECFSNVSSSNGLRVEMSNFEPT